MSEQDEATEVLINVCHGGFSVTDAVMEELGFDPTEVSRHDLWRQMGYDLNEHFAFRSDPRLIEAVREVGLERAAGPHAKLKIIEVPEDANEPYIDEYDGKEWISEGRTWS